MRLSVSMIVRDEEGLLPRCLESVRGADELVIVDTGSTDRTKGIAAEFGARVFDFAWCDDFSKARNFSLELCTGDWVLVIDADEVLEPGGIQKIRDAIEGAGAHRTVEIRMVAESDSEFHVLPRVFRKCSEVQWSGAIHEYLTIVESNPSEIVIRYGHSPAHLGDPDRAFRILKKAVAADPNAIRDVYYLAREYWYRKDYITAVWWYTDYLSRAVWLPEKADAWLMKARCLWLLCRGEEARDCCLQAIKINPQFAEAFRLLAEMSWPKYQKRWLAIADAATNDGVLFVRKPGGVP